MRPEALRLSEHLKFGIVAALKSIIALSLVFHTTPANAEQLDRAKMWIAPLGTIAFGAFSLFSEPTGSERVGYLRLGADLPISRRTDTILELGGVTGSSSGQRFGGVCGAVGLAWRRERPTGPWASFKLDLSRQWADAVERYGAAQTAQYAFAIGVGWDFAFGRIVLTPTLGARAGACFNCPTNLSALQTLLVTSTRIEAGSYARADQAFVTLDLDLLRVAIQL